jgi:hypothetical protein
MRRSLTEDPEGSWIPEAEIRQAPYYTEWYRTILDPWCAARGFTDEVTITNVPDFLIPEFKNYAKGLLSAKGYDVHCYPSWGQRDVKKVSPSERKRAAAAVAERPSMTMKNLSNCRESLLRRTSMPTINHQHCPNLRAKLHRLLSWPTASFRQRTHGERPKASFECKFRRRDPTRASTTPALSVSPLEWAWARAWARPWARLAARRKRSSPGVLPSELDNYPEFPHAVRGAFDETGQRLPGQGRVDRLQPRGGRAALPAHSGLA